MIYQAVESLQLALACWTILVVYRAIGDFQPVPLLTHSINEQSRRPNALMPVFVRQG